MSVKNEQLNFAVIIFLLFIALSIVFFAVKPDSLQSFLPFVTVAAPIVFLISFVNTDIALVLLIFSMLLSPEFIIEGMPGRDIVLRLDDIFILFVFLGWMAKMALNKELGLLKTTALSRPIIAYLMICVLSTGIGVLRETVSFARGFFYILKYLEYFVLFFMVANNIRSKAQVKSFVFFMLLTCVIVGIFGLYVTFAQGIRATAPFEGGAGEANTLAGYLLLIMGMAFGLFIYSESLNSKIILLGFLGFAIWPFLYTYSRGGLLGFAVMYLGIVLIVKKYKVGLILSFIVLMIIAPIIFQQPIFGRARQTFSEGKRYEFMGEKFQLDESASARIRSWQAAFVRWQKNPVLGEGVGSGRVMYDIQYGRVLREVGLVGFLAFLWMIRELLKLGWRNFNNMEYDGFSRGLSAGYFCALLGLLAMGLGAEVFIIIRIMEPFWFLTAIMVNLENISPSEEIPAVV